MRITPEILLSIMSNSIAAVAMNKDLRWVAFESIPEYKSGVWESEHYSTVLPDIFYIEYIGHVRDSLTLRTIEKVRFNTLETGQKFKLVKGVGTKVELVAISHSTGNYLCDNAIYPIDFDQLVEVVK